MSLQDSPVGTILYTSWGYDQTNIDFYQITQRRGQSTLVLQKLQTNEETIAWCESKVTPRAGEFTNDPAITCRVNKYGKASVAKYASLHLWDGQPKHATSYA